MITHDKLNWKRFFILMVSGFLVATPIFAESKAEKTKLKTLAILDFVDSEGYVTDDGEKTALLLFSGLAEHPEIKLLERSEMITVLKEQKLNQSGLVNPAKSIKIGKILGADYILTGKIYFLDDDINFNAKLIDCSSGKISGVSESYSAKKDRDEVIEKFAAKTAKYLVKKFNKKP